MTPINRLYHTYLLGMARSTRSYLSRKFIQFDTCQFGGDKCFNLFILFQPHMSKVGPVLSHMCLLELLLSFT